MSKYDGLTFEQLAKHADEGWDLLHKQTSRLREAVEALRGAEWVLICWARRLHEDYTTNVNLKEMIDFLEWGKLAFPEPGESMHDFADPVEPEESKGEVLPPGESIHDLPR